MPLFLQQTVPPSIINHKSNSVSLSFFKQKSPVIRKQFQITFFSDIICMSHHCLTVVSFIYIFVFFSYLYTYVQACTRNKKLSLFCTSVQKKVTVLFFVHSIAWTGEQMGGEERLGQSQRQIQREHYSDLGLLNLLLAVSSLNDVGISNGADVAVMLSD